jgi:DmsE family decaheme c-type cytochrome
MGYVTYICMALLAFASPGGASSQPGREACASCHEAVVEQFSANVHGRLREFEVDQGITGCPACHGDVEKHMESGNVKDLVRFGKDRQQDNQTCLRCHGRQGFAAFNGSVHASEAACTTCHTIHKSSTPSSSCKGCHNDVWSQTLAPSHHPIREGGMTCASCHDVHKANPGALATEGRINDLCVKCHSEKEGPFIFQHEPVEEDCTLCHQPHGSTADNLLVANEPFLCLQCHEFHFHTGLETRPETPTVTVGGRAYPNVLGAHGYQRSFATKCTQCHAQIHGSDSPSQGISGRGRALTR